MQDCFRKIWEKRQQLHEGAPLKGYLFTTAHHAILSQLRRSQHQQRFQTHMAALSPAVATNEAEYS